ncbi:PepSY-associated TM helix domain-containing protein [Sphingomonas sp. LT1P40]|uniref:PepSY-associated TM helix domain-containing protein n=1 Tax=Alteristakelama amylovorans TaxID=3096166 RepID=UPI002FCC98AC
MHGTTPAPRKRSRKSFWLKQLHTWHWISSAVSLVGLLLFAITGFTLNHAAEIEGSPTVVEQKAQLPAPLLATIKPDDAPDAKKPLPTPVADWVKTNLPVTRATGIADWSSGEIYLALPRPGGDGWVAIDRETGEITTEATDRGWIAWLNDLHKGRNSGTVWKWFIDIFVLACVVFSLTGLVLLQMHAKSRPSTWPLVIAGLVIPAILAIFFIH